MNNITATYTATGKKNASSNNPAMIHVIVNDNNEYYHKINFLYSKRDGWHFGCKFDEVLFKQYICSTVDIKEKSVQKYINAYWSYFNTMSKETQSFHPRKWEFLNE